MNSAESRAEQAAIALSERFAHSEDEERHMKAAIQVSMQEALRAHEEEAGKAERAKVLRAMKVFKNTGDSCANFPKCLCNFEEFLGEFEKETPGSAEGRR